jgi:hypothetical protein
MAVSTTNPNFMICGLQDNATFLYQGNPGCVRKIGGDGFSAAITPGNDNICFGSLYYFTIYKSTNKGSTFSTVNNNSNDAENACFSAPLVMSKNSPSTLYGGTIYVKKSTNQGSAWSNANGGLILSNASAPIIKMAVSDYNVNKLYASTCRVVEQEARYSRALTAPHRLLKSPVHCLIDIIPTSRLIQRTTTACW